MSTLSSSFRIISLLLLHLLQIIQIPNALPKIYGILGFKKFLYLLQSTEYIFFILFLYIHKEIFPIYPSKQIKNFLQYKHPNP